MFVCCKAFDEVGRGCGAVLCPADRPSPLFTLYTFLVNGIGAIIVGAAFGASDSQGTCSNGSTRTWNYVYLAICAVNCLFAIYVYMRYVQKLREGHGAGGAAYKLLLYDWGCYLMFWFLVFIVVWLCLASNYTSGETRCSSLASTGAPVAAMVVWMVGGVFVVWMSLLTECCRSPKWAGERQVGYAPVAVGAMGGNGGGRAQPPAPFVVAPRPAPVYAAAPVGVAYTPAPATYGPTPATYGPTPTPAATFAAPPPPPMNPAYSAAPAPGPTPAAGGYQPAPLYQQPPQQQFQPQWQTQQQPQQQQQQPGVLGRLAGTVQKTFV